MRTYEELSAIDEYKKRYEYLRISGSVGEETFGFERYLNQKFYTSKEWRDVRSHVIARDNGCDMGHPDHPINGKIYIHHMNPMSPKDIAKKNVDILNPDFLVCVSMTTHNAIHYGDDSLLPQPLIERSPNDTCPWKR